MSVAAYWAGAAHPRRQKRREMPPPGASAPAFAATVEPTSTQITSGIPPTYLRRDSSNERVLKMACCMHRFLISSPDLRIDACFSPFTPSCVHRFLNSSPDLGIDAAENSFACYGRSGNTLLRPTLIYVAAKGDGFAYCGRLRLRCSATDSNFRCCKGE